ncbi:MAG: hypothetical protein IKF39_11905 [Oscillospiraceae bacterium]|nr:hypothetical protein [Oscillospiraceae bacterium]
MNRKKKAINSLKGLPTWLLIDAVAIGASWLFDKYLLPNTSYSSLRVTPYVAIAFAVVTGLALIAALFRVLSWLIQGDK